MSVYQEYAEQRIPHPRSVPLLMWWHRQMARGYEKLSGRSLSNLRVLEVGVGHLYFALEVQSLGSRYTGLEMSEPLVSEAQSAGLDCRLARIPPLPQDLRNSADVLWMSHVLEHAKDWTEARAMVLAAYEALKPGGDIVVIGPDATDWKEEFFNVDWSHGYPTTLRRCTQLLQDCGFSVKAVHHRGGFFGLGKTAAWLIAVLVPHSLHKLLYSYMTVFGWRQIMCVGRKNG